MSLWSLLIYYFMLPEEDVRGKQTYSLPSCGTRFAPGCFIASPILLAKGLGFWFFVGVEMHLFGATHSPVLQACCSRCPLWALGCSIFCQGCFPSGNQTVSGGCRRAGGWESLISSMDAPVLRSEWDVRPYGGTWERERPSGCDSLAWKETGASVPGCRIGRGSMSIYLHWTCGISVPPQGQVNGLSGPESANDGFLSLSSKC